MAGRGTAGTRDQHIFVVVVGAIVVVASIVVAVAVSTAVVAASTTVVDTVLVVVDTVVVDIEAVEFAVEEQTSFVVVVVGGRTRVRPTREVSYRQRRDSSW